MAELGKLIQDSKAALNTANADTANAKLGAYLDELPGYFDIVDFY